MTDNPRVPLYPVLPLRDIVVFPHMIVPLFVGRKKSVRALEDVMKEDKQILLVALARYLTDMHTAYPSQLLLAGDLGRGTSWVSAQMAKLKKSGCIEVVRKPTRGRNTEYHLHLDDETHHR